MQAVQGLDLAVHVLDFLLQVLPRDVHLLAQLGKHSGQLPATHARTHTPAAGQDSDVGEPSQRYRAQLQCSLLDLVAAVGSSVADDELQLLAGVVHKLPLEGPLLGPGGPGQALVHVQQPVETHRQGDQTPAHRLPDLTEDRTTGSEDLTGLLLDHSETLHFTRVHPYHAAHHQDPHGGA